MCEKCVERANINLLLAQTIGTLAGAAATLAQSVPGSDVAVKGIIQQIQDATQGNAQASSSPDIGSAPEPTQEQLMDEEIQKVSDMLRMMGIPFTVQKHRL